jgi:hypothetical protein
MEKVGAAELAAEDATAAHVLVLVANHLVTDRTLVQIGIIFTDGAFLALMHSRSHLNLSRL